jgi:hypothetical protein
MAGLLKRLFGKREAAAEPELIYVHLPGAIQPAERGARFEDPLDEELRRLKIGSVSGGGTQLGEERADGSRAIEACGVDVDADNLPAVLAHLRDRLPALGCPSGTQIQYCSDEADVLDEYDGSEWAVGRPNELPGPG